MSSDKRTVIEEGTEFRGSMSAKHPVVVHGTLDGDLTGPALHVEPSGVVSGRVLVAELRASGEIAGEIEADEVFLSGRVRDKTVLRAKQLEVKSEGERHLGDMVMGECDIEVGDVPDRKAVIAAARERNRRPGAGAIPESESAAGDTSDTELPHEITASAGGRSAKLHKAAG